MTEARPEPRRPGGVRRAQAAARRRAGRISRRLRGAARRHPGPAAALSAWLEARLYVAAAFAVTFSVLDRLGPESAAAPARDGLLAWDGRWYQTIAEAGYGGVSDPALRFFPLWPLLGRIVGGLTGIDKGLILAVLANAFALAAGVLLHRLVVEETGDPALARRAVKLLALAPPSFALVLGYSEALYLTLALTVFLTVRRRAWWAAAAVGYLAGLTRPVGALLTLPVAWEMIAARAQRRPGALAAALAPAAGAATFLGWAGLALGGAAGPLDRQQDLRGWSEPVSRLVQAAYRGIRGDEGELFHFLAAVIAIGLTAVAARRLSRSMALYCGASVLVMLAATELNGFERYCLGAFPLVIAAASLSLHRRLDGWIVTASGAGLVALTALALGGAYSP